MQTTNIPVPDLSDPLFAPFWEALRDGRLSVQSCGSCGLIRWPPRAACRSCHSFDVAWIDVSAVGTLFTWTVVTHPMMPAFRDSVPYVVGLVTLDARSDVRILGNVVDIPPDELWIGMPLTAEFPAAGKDGAFNVIHWKPSQSRL